MEIDLRFWRKIRNEVLNLSKEIKELPPYELNSYIRKTEIEIEISELLEKCSMILSNCGVRSF